MNKDLVEKIKNDPNYKELVSKRMGFSIKLTVAVIVVYFAFILTIAFDPAILGTQISAGSVTTIGIPIGMLIILFAFILTGIYTKRANSEFDDLTNKIKDAVKEH